MGLLIQIPVFQSRAQQPFFESQVSKLHLQEKQTFKQLMEESKTYNKIPLLAPILKIQAGRAKKKEKEKRMRILGGNIKHFAANVWQDEALISLISSFLQFEDWRQLRDVSQLLRKSVIVMMLNNPGRLLEFQLFFVNRAHSLLPQIGDQQSQHSVDLDRSYSYFSNKEIEERDAQCADLDRVLTAVSFKICYFQGILPIAVAMIEWVGRQTAEKLLRYLLFKTGYIQNNPKQYLIFISRLESSFADHLPELFRHFSENDLQLSYFAMRWVMGLFSQDLPPLLLFDFWSLLLMDFQMLVCMCLAILQTLERELLAMDGDGINEFLKAGLKSRLGNQNKDIFLGKVKKLYLNRKASK